MSVCGSGGVSFLSMVAAGFVGCVLAWLGLGAAVALLLRHRKTIVAWLTREDKADGA